MSAGVNRDARVEVVVYGRDDCHLCVEAIARIYSSIDRALIDLRVVDIEQDDLLHARYLERIPVVTIDGETVTELDEFRGDQLTAGLLAASLRRMEAGSDTY